MLLAPIVTGIASLLLRDGVDAELNTSAKIATALAATDGKRTQTYVAYVLVTLGLTLLIVAWGGIARLAPSSWLNLTGALLAVVGLGAGIATNALTGFTLFVASDPNLRRPTGEAFLDRLWNDHAIPPLFLGFVLLPLGMILAIIGLLRARAARWWEIAVWAAGLALLFFSSGGWIGALASLVMLTGFALLASRLNTQPAQHQ
jgi:hypothetical protein